MATYYHTAAVSLVSSLYEGTTTKPNERLEEHNTFSGSSIVTDRGISLRFHMVDHTSMEKYVEAELSTTDTASVRTSATRPLCWAALLCRKVVGRILRSAFIS